MGSEDLEKWTVEAVRVNFVSLTSSKRCKFHQEETSVPLPGGSLANRPDKHNRQKSPANSWGRKGPQKTQQTKRFRVLAAVGVEDHWNCLELLGTAVEIQSESGDMP